MIIKASQRGGAGALATHLLNAEDNEHIDVHAINGFVADDVHGAFQEIEAISRATSCKQFLFSVSFSPPKDAVVSDAEFETAIEDAVSRTGLSGQPHVVIFHEKHGRRHAHLVVSRIDTDQMKAINLSFFKDRLMELSRELYVRHGWEMPKGHQDRVLSDPLNYTLEEYQVAARAKRDPQKIKVTLRTAWDQSDGRAGFIAALRDSGFELARGDRRGFVAVDSEGKIYSLSRWLGVKTKILRARLGDPEALPPVDAALAELQNQPVTAPSENVATQFARIDAQISAVATKKATAIAEHRLARAALRAQHTAAEQQKIRDFTRAQYSLRGLFQFVSGQRGAQLVKNKAELAGLKSQHDQEELELSARQTRAIRDYHAQMRALEAERDALLGAVPTIQKFELLHPQDADALFTTAQIRAQPERILEVITDTRAQFSAAEIWTELERFIPDPDEHRAAYDAVLPSPELIKVPDADGEFTTRKFQNLETQMHASVRAMATTKAFGVQPRHRDAAVARLNAELENKLGARLSEEQCKSIDHVLNRRQFAAVVGYAGAGKSTMLAAAKEAWTRQGYRVLGGALAGKAADGLQDSSGIPSRTLASWQMSWDNQRNRLQPGDVLVIDEAGMIGSKQMATIVREVQKRQAKLVLVGDPAQLQPINAGTPFADIVETNGAAHLTEIRRQKIDWQKQASQSLAIGEIDNALRAYEDHEAVTQAGTRDEAIAKLVEAYMSDLELHGKEKSRIALAHSRADVHAINLAVRHARKSAGELLNEEIMATVHGKRAFAPGDRILLTKNDAGLGVRNGMQGEVVEISADAVAVQIDGRDKPLAVNTNQYQNIEYGYATTVHKSQGATVDNAFVLQSPRMDDHLKYVAMTRHRDALCMFKFAGAPRLINTKPDQQPDLGRDQDLSYEL